MSEPSGWEKTIYGKMHELQSVADWAAIVGQGRVRDYCQNAIAILRSVSERLAELRKCQEVSTTDPCKHLFNAHHQCQWCKRTKDDIELETLRHVFGQIKSLSQQYHADYRSDVYAHETLRLLDEAGVSEVPYLPVAYNGKSAKEWYQEYCKVALASPRSSDSVPTDGITAEQSKDPDSWGKD